MMNNIQTVISWNSFSSCSYIIEYTSNQFTVTEYNWLSKQKPVSKEVSTLKADHEIYNTLKDMFIKTFGVTAHNIYSYLIDEIMKFIRRFKSADRS